jgi:stage V sporulation protein G
MKITEIRIYRSDESRVRAYAMLTIDDCFVVRGIRILEGSHGLFLAWPSRRRGDGTYEDYVHVLSDEAYACLEAAILRAYEDGGVNGPSVELPPPVGGTSIGG